MVGFGVRERLVGACDVAVPPPLPSALVARLPFFAHNHAFKGRLLVSHHSSQRVPNSFSEKHNATRQFPFSQFDTISPRLQKDHHIRNSWYSKEDDSTARVLPRRMELE